MNKKHNIVYVVVLLLLFSCKKENTAAGPRLVVNLNEGWQSVVLDSLTMPEDQFVKNGLATTKTTQVNVPHNWDQYYGYRRGKHGNLHGTAWYSKTFTVPKQEKGKRYFLFFEGVGSYATVWVNGTKVGEHKGGRTSFTLDISNAIAENKQNKLVVKAGHPSFISDLPWVCGGCSGEWGFSEGSQPMGIFRPVSLLVTNNVKVEPFGVHIYKKSTLAEADVKLSVTTEVKNYGNFSKKIEIIHKLQNGNGEVVTSSQRALQLNASVVQQVEQELSAFTNAELWSPENPYMYTLTTTVKENDVVVDEVKTDYGIRWVSWPTNRQDGDARLLINGKPYFLNGTCEYEHLMGNSHSFSNTEIASRIQQVKDAGFNAFREAHQPHNLKYQEYLDKEGILFWSQFSAHIWYDTPEFKANFKQLLKEWIKERRNSPSVILWGLQNESTIPTAFAEECTQIIREMDPEASDERLVTTCNGGDGTDWNVIQNWSGTYGGNPYNYGEELKKDLLNGEYGAWRMADVHTEGPFEQKGTYSEERFSQLMEIKVAEAEKVKDSVVGHFNWLFSSHENPGRIQNGEAYRDIDRVGPVNYKGLQTAWGEPLETYYMYAGNYANKTTNPMVYIAAHSWPNRWSKGGIKDSIVVYSNCDEVALFNDVDGELLGKLTNKGVGTHFQWDSVLVKYNVLYAKGYVNGKQVATDVVVLNGLPQAPNFNKLYTNTEVLTPNDSKNYVYRVNAGGPAFTDSFGNTWMADVHKTEEQAWGSTSWTDDFTNLPAFYASQRQTFDPIKNSSNWQLFQTFRYGTNKLKYHFPLENGTYTVELYFTEPWYGVGSTASCKNYRVFDVAINGTVVEDNLDIWSQVGYATALKKTYNVSVTNGQLTIGFPEVLSGQAVLSGIAILGKKQSIAKWKPQTIQGLQALLTNAVKVQSWLDVNQSQFINSTVTWTQLPYEVYGAEWLQFAKNAFEKGFSTSFTVKQNSTIYALVNAKNKVEELAWLKDFKLTEEVGKNSLNEVFSIYKKEFKKGEKCAFNALANGANFTLVIVPTYQMGEEEEARPILKLEAETAKVSGNFSKDFFKKSDYIGFKSGVENSIEWEVKTGLAGVHLLRFRYMNMNDNPVKVRLQIIAPNGAKMRDDEVAFPVQQEKWKILNTTTGGYINAGTYKVIISGDNLAGLRLESMEFQ